MEMNSDQGARVQKRAREQPKRVEFGVANIGTEK